MLRWSTLIMWMSTFCGELASGGMRPGFCSGYGRTGSSRVFHFLLVKLSSLLPLRELTFDSPESKVFQSFRSGIIEVIRHLASTIGFVDYEEDYYCEGPRDKSDVVLRWGTYLTWSILSSWSLGDVATLLEAADITTEIVDRGLPLFSFHESFWVDRLVHPPAHADSRTLRQELRMVDVWQRCVVWRAALSALICPINLQNRTNRWVSAHADCKITELGG